MSDLIYLNRGADAPIGLADLDVVDDRTVLDLWVAGVPRPKGSLRFVTRRYAKEQNETSPEWRNHVIGCVMEVFKAETVTTAVRLEAEFVFALPKTARGKDRPAISRALGDLDKLVRNVGDALEDAGVVANDAQIVKTVAEKRYARAGEGPGARIRVVVLE